MGLQGAWTAEVVSQKDQLRGPAATFMLRGPAARIHPESVFRNALLDCPLHGTSNILAASSINYSMLPKGDNSLRLVTRLTLCWSLSSAIQLSPTL